MSEQSQVCEETIMSIGIQKIKQKIASMQNGEVQLLPPLEPNYIKAWEQKHNVTLPSDYAAFVTEIGDGGTVPNITPDCNKLVSFRDYEKQGYSFSHVMLPFTLKNSWMPDWGDTIEGVAEEELEHLTEERWNMIHHHGSITLMEDATCNYHRWFLVVTGSCSGEVWVETEFGVLRCPDCTFSKWLLLLLNGEWEEYVNRCADIEVANWGQKTLTEKCLQALKEVHIVPKPPIKISVIKDFESRHQIQLPNSFIKFYSSIANGGKVKRGEYPQLYSIEELDACENLNLPFFIQSEEQLKNLVMQAKGRTDGSLPLLARPKSMRQGQLFLILNGAFRGQIWSANQVELIPKVDHKFANGNAVNTLNFLLAYSQGKDRQPHYFVFN